MKKLLFFLLVFISPSVLGSQWVQVNHWAVPYKVNTNSLEVKLWEYINKTSKRSFQPKESYIYQYKTINDKELYINSLCSNIFKADLTQEFLVVYDGGSCYFQATYNLKTNTFVKLEVNGES
jgi:hypothetical protein